MQPGGRGRVGGRRRSPDAGTAGGGAAAPRGVHGRMKEIDGIPARHAEGLRRPPRPRVRWRASITSGSARLRRGGGILGFNDASEAPNVTEERRSPRLLREGHRENLGRQPAEGLAGRGNGGGAEQKAGGNRTAGRGDTAMDHRLLGRTGVRCRALPRRDELRRRHGRGRGGPDDRHARSTRHQHRRYRRRLTRGDSERIVGKPWRRGVTRWSSHQGSTAGPGSGRRPG